MKKNILLFSLVIVLAFVGCKSKEDKAADLIRKELAKTLYDFDSYQPIETTVVEAKNTMYNDSACWAQARIFYAACAKLTSYTDAMKEDLDHIDIWGPPSYYSSSYSDRKYYEYREKYNDDLSKAEAALSTCKIKAKELKATIFSLDTTQVIGWEVTHHFRCKTRGGMPDLGHYRYIIDKKFERILLIEDLDDETDGARVSLESVRAGRWDDDEDDAVL